MLRWNALGAGGEIAMIRMTQKDVYGMLKDTRRQLREAKKNIDFIQDMYFTPIEHNEEYTEKSDYQHQELCGEGMSAINAALCIIRDVMREMR